MVIYIAGKITGDPNYKKKFAKAKRELYDLLKDDYDDLAIINPAEFPEGLTPRDYMHYSFDSIDAADFIAILPDAHDSAGARLELQYIEYTGQYDKLTEKAFERGKHDLVRKARGRKARSV